MKLLLFIPLILLLLRSQATLTNFPGGPLESYKDYLRGLCTATDTDCDLSSVSSCWDETSAGAALIMMYQACSSVARSPLKETPNILRSFVTQDYKHYLAPVTSAMRCAENLPYARMLHEKISWPERGLEGTIENLIHYASMRPESCYTAMKSIVALADQGNFEAVGMLIGNLMSQAATLRRTGSPHWQTSAKNGRRLLLKGMCESLGLDCPMNSLNCMNEEGSAVDLRFVYEWAQSVATKSPISGAKSGVEFISGRGKEIMDLTPRPAMECDRNSQEIRLINEKLGFDVWDEEWYTIICSFLNEFPELSWYFKVSEYRLFESNDLEGVGAVMGLHWIQVSEWKHGRFIKRTGPSMSDL